METLLLMDISSQTIIFVVTDCSSGEKETFHFSQIPQSNVKERLRFFQSEGVSRDVTGINS